MSDISIERATAPGTCLARSVGELGGSGEVYMDDDCNKPRGGWTTDALHKHFAALREADQEQVKALREAMDYRLAGMNEFRKSLEDLSAIMLPRKEAWGFLMGALGFIFSVITTAALIWNALNN